MADKNLHITLTADVSNYLAGMKRAIKATRRLTKAYHSLPRAARIVVRASLK